MNQTRTGGVEKPQPGVPTRIAIVEDDRILCVALTRLLRANGFLVSSFPSAEAFLAREVAELPDCLVVDLNLGGMSGLDLQAALAARGESVLWIVITAQDSPRVRARCLQAGAAAYLVKPFDDRQLNEAIQGALDGAPLESSRDRVSGR